MKKLDKLTYVKEAENVIKGLKRGNNGKFSLTTNQIRNLLDMMNELYLKIQHSSGVTLSEDVQSHVQYVKMKFAYAAGRDGGEPVKELLNRTCLLDQLDQVGESREYLLLLCHYMEALVAYHKFYYSGEERSQCEQPKTSFPATSHARVIRRPNEQRRS